MFSESGSSQIADLFHPNATEINPGRETSSQGRGRNREDSTCRLVAQGHSVDGINEESFDLDRDTCIGKLNELAESGRRIMLQGLPIEDIARFCFDYGYRWRFHKTPDGRSAFLLERVKSEEP